MEDIADDLTALRPRKIITDLPAIDPVTAAMNPNAEIENLKALVLELRDEMNRLSEVVFKLQKTEGSPDGA